MNEAKYIRTPTADAPLFHAIPFLAWTSLMHAAANELHLTYADRESGMSADGRSVEGGFLEDGRRAIRLDSTEIIALNLEAYQDIGALIFEKHARISEEIKEARQQALSLRCRLEFLLAEERMFYHEARRMNSANNLGPFFIAGLQRPDGAFEAERQSEDERVQAAAPESQ